MKRRQFLGTVAALGAAATTGACGIPGDSEPRFLESGRPVEPLPGTPAEPPGPSSAASAAELVTNYLKAAAGANYGGGEKPETLTKAQERARAYLHPSVQSGWQPGKSLIVVRASVGTTSPAGAGAVVVNVGLAVVGELTNQGMIEPTAAELRPEPFTVVAFGSEYRLAGAPRVLLLSDEGLKQYYTSQVIYFWDKPPGQQQPLLVPDQRYLPKSIGSGKQPADVLAWLSADKPPWLAAVLGAQPLDGIEVKDVSMTDQQRLIVNLSAKAANIDKHLLAVQLRWSTGAAGGVDLRIEGASTGVSSDDYLNYNASAARPDNRGEPERFCIENRKVRPVDANNLTQVLDHGANVDVTLAAIAVRKRTAALVKQEAPKGKTVQRLWVGALSGTGDTKPPVYAPTSVVAQQSVSRPVWVSRPSPLALVAADGKLYSVPPPAPGHTDEIPATLVPLPAGLAPAVTALSVSPDGRRIALIVAGQVVIAPLKMDDALAIETYRIISTDLTDQRTVAWSAETKLLVGGAPIKDTKNNLFEIAINGAGQEPVPPGGTDTYTIDLVSVRPASPTDPRRLAMYDANGAAYNVYAAEVRLLTLSGPSPQPSASTPAGDSHLRAPFFLD